MLYIVDMLFVEVCFYTVHIDEIDVVVVCSSYMHTVSVCEIIVVT